MDKKTQRLARWGIIGATGAYLFLIGTNHLFFNREYYSDDRALHSVSEPVNTFYPWSHIQLSRFVSDGKIYSDRVYVFNFLSDSEFYTDGGGDGKYDGLVDRIHVISHFGDDLWIKRSEHFEQFRSKFEEADKILADTKERFKDYFQK